jgi:hypothetical protein
VSKEKVDQSFVDLLKEDYVKKSFRARQRKMQGIIEANIKTIADPKTHSR